MRRRSTWILAGVVALTFAVVATAVAVTQPSLTARPTAVTYPHSAKLISSVETTSVVMRLLAGASEWTTFAVVPAGESTRVVNRPKSSATYKLVSDSIESTPVTITVRAQLTKPQVIGRGHKKGLHKVNGAVAPLHATGGQVQLSFFLWKKLVTTATARGGNGHQITRYEWVQSGDTADVPLTRRNSQWSKWTYRWRPSAIGTWKVVVSHEDTAHVAASASTKVRIRR